MQAVQTSAPVAPSPAFRLRGSNISLVVLELHETDRDAILEPLQRLLSKAPAFLWQAPIILGLAPDLVLERHFDLAGLVADLNTLNLYPIGILGGPETWQAEAAALGLPVMPKGTQRSLTVETKQPPANAPEPEPVPASNENAAAATQPPLEETRKPTMLITKPVRAGTEIYADGGADLIVTATVNAGAEIIADGNIHVYGTLRGRAIAGARGNEEARIFAMSLDPELLAIGGFYTMHDEIEPGLVKQAVQVSLEQRSFQFNRIKS